MSLKSWFAISISILLCAGVAGCASVSYYSQSVAGHSRIMLAREPISKVIQVAPDALRNKLELTISLRKFAVEQLGLPDNKSYTHYVELDRPYVVWNVVAAPEFSVNSKQWCYLVIGCAGYRGYYKEKAALNYARGLEERGFETLVGGVTAYSTLGWFADPVLSSMLQYDDIELAETLFHELAHQVLYVDDNTEFNEAFATVVGEAGVRKWLSATRPEALEHYQQRVGALTQFNRIVSGSKERLAELYAKDQPAQQMRVAKHLEFDRLYAEYQQLKQEVWNGKPWFDRWFETPLNNARFAAFANYREAVPELQSLLSDCGNELEKFYSILTSAAQSKGPLRVPENCED